MNSRGILTAAMASCLGILAAVTVVHAQPGNNSAPPEVRKAVLARMAEIQTAAEALDADKVFSFVVENDSGALVQNGRLFLTQEEAWESTRQGFQGLQKVDYRFDKQFVTLLSPTVALATGEGESSATTVDGRTFRTRFAQSVVLVLTDGGWKVFHAHRSFPRSN
jgi:ketosteroid isomerase-like protein